MDNKNKIAINGMLLATAIFWGSGFAARKITLIYLTPFFGNGVRFFVGDCFVFIVYFIIRYQTKKKNGGNVPENKNKPLYYQMLGGFLAGTLLAFASALQQWSMLTTTAGKVSFITSLYAIFVPIISVIFFKAKVKPKVWVGAGLAIVGLFLISGGLDSKIATGDLFALMGAIIFALQILAIGYFSRHSDGVFLCGVQLFTGGVFNFIFAFAAESGNTIEGVLAAAGPILYSGIFSLGIAYTFQIVAQKRAASSVVAVIFSLESVFGAIFGMIILSERMSFMQIFGCALIFLAVLIVQYEGKKHETSRTGI